MRFRCRRAKVTAARQIAPGPSVRAPQPRSKRREKPRRFRRFPLWRIEIIATDLSQGALEKSKAGLYSQFEVQHGLPIQMLLKYFKQVGELWQINADIRAMVQHRQLNLLHDFSELGVFDLIFCRNVLIYFDQQTKTSVLNRLAKVIEADGFLMLGAAETVFGLTNVFKPMAERRAVYQPNEVRAASVRTSAFVAPASAVTATARI